VNHAIKQQDKAFSTCTVRLKMFWTHSAGLVFDAFFPGYNARGGVAAVLNAIESLLQRRW
jgi:hypothetical protein